MTKGLKKLQKTTFLEKNKPVIVHQDDGSFFVAFPPGTPEEDKPRTDDELARFIYDSLSNKTCRCLWNGKSGELMETGPREALQIATARSVTSAQLAAQKSYAERQEKIKCHKNAFIWVSYTPQQSFIPTLSDRELNRFVMMSSMCSYDNILQTNRMTVPAPQLATVLGVSNQTARSVLQKLIDEHMCWQNDDGSIGLNPSIAYRGTLDSKAAAAMRETENIYYTRMYLGAVKELYKAYGGLSALGRLFRLIPYLHRSFNCLCRDIDETDYRKIRPLNRKALSKILGVPEARIKGILDEMAQLRFTSPLSGELVQAFRWEQHPTSRSVLFYINPFLVHADCEWDTVVDDGNFEKHSIPMTEEHRDAVDSFEAGRRSKLNSNRYQTQKPAQTKKRKHYRPRTKRKE